MNPDLINIILVLRQHVGRDNIIRALDLAEDAGIRGRSRDRSVRDLLTEALHDGTLEELEVPLCGIPGRGYFLAADIEEAQAYSDWCHALAAEAARKSKAVRGLFGSFGLHLTKP